MGPGLSIPFIPRGRESGQLEEPGCDLSEWRFQIAAMHQAIAAVPPALEQPTIPVGR